MGRRKSRQGVGAAIIAALALVFIQGFFALASAHGIGGSDAAFVAATDGPDPFPFLYLGAKHMVTGYDHLLFLAGVIFFLYRMRDVGIYVTLFAIGHSTTLLAGVLLDIRADAYIIDAIIGVSVAYKAFDNLGGFRQLGWQPNARGAVLIFGFFHGFGLATKLQDLTLSPDGMIPNLIAFNVGVELGQLLALSLILIVMNFWRLTASFRHNAVRANAVLMSAGFVLVGYQLTGYFTQGA